MSFWCFLMYFHNTQHQQPTSDYMQHFGIQVNLTEQYPSLFISVSAGAVLGSGKHYSMCSSSQAFCFLFIWRAPLKWFGCQCLTLPSSALHKLLLPSSQTVNMTCHQFKFFCIYQRSGPCDKSLFFSHWLLFYFGKHTGQSYLELWQEKKRNICMALKICVF